MANEDYIDVKFDIFEYTGQRACVRRSLTVRALIDEILREFDDIPPDPSNKYVLYLKDLDQPLDYDKNLIELDIQTHDQLVFDRYRTFLRRPLPPDVQAAFVDDHSAEVYDIQWYPAIIGRLTTDMDHNFSLALNLQNLPGGKTVSRRHAQVLYRSGKFFIEPLAEHNPVFLNGTEMPCMKRFEIKDGDKLSLGFRRITLTFNCRTLSPDALVEQGEPADQAGQQPSEASPEAASPGKASQLNQIESTAEGTGPDGEAGKPQLVITAAGNPANIGQSIKLDAVPLTIGRTLPLLSDEKDISRLHAEITFDQDKQAYYIKDLNSTNGVAINGQIIKPDTLSKIIPGCHIRLGMTVLARFEIGA